MPVEPPVISPRDLAEAYAILAAADPDAPVRPVAGGTDLLVALTGELGEPPAGVLDLWAIDGLRGIAVDGGALSLGALTTYAEIRRSPLCREHVPALVEAAATIGAVQIQTARHARRQHRQRVAGRRHAAGPAGRRCHVRRSARARGEREVAAADFWTGYRQTALAHDELVVRIRIPLGPDREMRFRKVGTRRAQSISKVVLAVAWRRPANGTRGSAAIWRDVRVALGSVAATPIRAARTEAVLEGSPPTPETADRAAETLAASSSPSTTSARPPGTGASWRPGSSTGSSARPAAGETRRDARRRPRRRGAACWRRAAPRRTSSPSAAPLPASPEVAVPPDGLIAFARTIFDPATNTPTGGDIWSVGTDGADLVQLTDLPELELFPAWSPDGARLAFVRTADTTTGDVWLIDADPTAADRHLVQLTDEPGLEMAPAWSPDGRWIAYVADWQDAPSIWIRAADGTGEPRRVADGNWPSWTPDGTRLLVTVGSDFTDDQARATCRSTAVSPRSCRSRSRTRPRRRSARLARSPSCRAPTATRRTTPRPGTRTSTPSAPTVGAGRPRSRSRRRTTTGRRRGPRTASGWPTRTTAARPGRGSRSCCRPASRIYLTEGSYDAFPAWRPQPEPAPDPDCDDPRCRPRPTLAPLFEGAPRFLARLEAAGPFATDDALFETARRIAHEMPEPDQVELIDAHPRLGAPPGTVSAMSFTRTGVRPGSRHASATSRPSWRRRNDAYEARFGFRYCVFVNGRSREALLPGMTAALEADRDAELHRALDAVVDIAIDRAASRREAESRR